MAIKTTHLSLFCAMSAFSSLLLITACGAGANSPSSNPVSPSFQISVSLPPAGAGSVTSTPKGINCPPTCKASFPQNTQVKLTATPGSNYSFDGWKGACSGMKTCTVTGSNSNSVIATFAFAGNSGAEKNVIAYIFTPDGLTLTTPEFALLSNGELEATNRTVQPRLMARTPQGVVMDLPAANGTSSPTGSLQSYAVETNGSVKPLGNTVTFPIDKYASSLASDGNYVYAVSDVGLFSFEDTAAGLTTLPPIDESVPRPCTSAEENSNECVYSAFLVFGKTAAVFMESAALQSGVNPTQLSSFALSQGQLTGEQLLSQSPPWVEAIAGNFAYALNNQPSGTSINVCTVAGNFACSPNVLSSGQHLSDAFAQLLVNPTGSFLFGVVYDGSSAPRVRVFQINSASGALTEVPGSPFLTGEYYFVSAALDPSGRFLLTLSASCNNSGPCDFPGKLSAMRINSTTGALSFAGDIEDGQFPYTIYPVSISP